MAYLKIENLKKHFGKARALDDISLNIEAGEFICFLGPSGCGKTTLLRSICGLETQDSGIIIQGGTNISNLPAEQRDFGIVFQSYALFPNLSVFDNIAFGLVNQRRPKQFIKEKVNELLALTGLDGHTSKYPAQLSGGQQQRVALARALAMEPGLLLLDEPLSALDAKIREHLRREICRVHKKLGLTSIMVTHDQAEAMTMADRIVVMNAGKIEQIGTPEEIYLHPASAFVADFVGTSNTLLGQFENNALQLPGWSSTLQVESPSPALTQSVLVRPEHLQIHSEPPATPHASARVGAIEFLGAQLLVELHLENSQEKPLKAALPLAEAHSLQLTSNKPTWVSVEADNCCLLPNGDSVGAVA